MRCLCVLNTVIVSCGGGGNSGAVQVGGMNPGIIVIVREREGGEGRGRGKGGKGGRGRGGGGGGALCMSTLEHNYSHKLITF